MGLGLYGGKRSPQRVLKADGTQCRTPTPNELTNCSIRLVSAASDFGALLPFDHTDVILALQVQPGLSAVAKISSEPHRCVGCDGATAIEYARNDAKCCL